MWVNLLLEAKWKFLTCFLNQKLKLILPCLTWSREAEENIFRTHYASWIPHYQQTLITSRRHLLKISSFRQSLRQLNNQLAGFVVNGQSINRFASFHLWIGQLRRLNSPQTWYNKSLLGCVRESVLVFVNVYFFVVLWIFHTFHNFIGRIQVLTMCTLHRFSVRCRFGLMNRLWVKSNQKSKRTPIDDLLIDFFISFLHFVQ